jgi:hypothetical protein
MFFQEGHMAARIGRFHGVCFVASLLATSIFLLMYGVQSFAQMLPMADGLDERRSQFIETQQAVHQQYLLNAPQDTVATDRVPSEHPVTLPSSTTSQPAMSPQEAGQAKASSNSKSRNANRPYLSGSTFTPIAASSSSPVLKNSAQAMQTMDADSLPVVEVNANVTTNMIWRATNTYHVTGTIYVQALLVIEPGTTVSFTQNAGLRVNNGGCLLAVGAPGRLINFQGDVAGYGYYYSPFYIESTASVSCKLSFCMVQGAYLGASTRGIRLNEPIQHNYFLSCVYGIAQSGTSLTDIFNNVVYSSYYDGMYISMASSSGQVSADTHVRIQNNTCDSSQYNNITVSGVPSEADAGTVELINNVVTYSYGGYGINLVNGYMHGYVIANGYYYNGAYYGGNRNKNWAFEEYGAVVASADPYATMNPNDPLSMWCLAAGSPFVDVGCGGIDTDTGEIESGTITQIPSLVGSTTYTTRECDIGIIDLGFHSSNFNEVTAPEFLPADVNYDGTVNADDRAIVQAHYGQAGTHNEGDINGDGIVDMYDLQILRQQTGQTGYASLELEVSLSEGNADNISGDAHFFVNGDLAYAEQMFVFLDGMYVKEITDIQPSSCSFVLPSNLYANGSHSLKIVSTDNREGAKYPVVLHPNFQLTFNNTFYCMTAKDNSESGQDYSLLGFCDGASSVAVNVTDVLTDAVLWSGTSNASVNISVPQSSFSSSSLFRIGLAQNSRDGSDGQGWIKTVAPKFDKNDPRVQNAKVLLTIPDKEVYQMRKTAIKDAYNAFQARGVGPIVVLYDGDCSWKNLRYMIQEKESVPIRYWYHVGHGSWYRDKRFWYWPWQKLTVYRLSIVISDAVVFSYLQSDMPMAPELPGGWDKKGKSFASLGLHDSSSLKFVFFDTCWQASGNEMARQFGMFSYSNMYVNMDQVFVSWLDQAMIGPFAVHYNTFLHQFWAAIGFGWTVFDAYTAGASGTVPSDVYSNFWGYGWIQNVVVED